MVFFNSPSWTYKTSIINIPISTDEILTDVPKPQNEQTPEPLFTWSYLEEFSCYSKALLIWEEKSPAPFIKVHVKNVLI